jgi:hypothetical protein
MASCQKQILEWAPWFTFLKDGKTMQCMYCHNRYQYKQEQAFDHFGYSTKSTQVLCIKYSSLVKSKIAGYGNIVLARMSFLEKLDVGGFQEVLG